MHEWSGLENFLYARSMFWAIVQTSQHVIILAFFVYIASFLLPYVYLEYYLYDFLIEMYYLYKLKCELYTNHQALQRLLLLLLLQERSVC